MSAPALTSVVFSAIAAQICDANKKGKISLVRHADLENTFFSCGKCFLYMYSGDDALQAIVQIDNLSLAMKYENLLFKFGAEHRAYGRYQIVDVLKTHFKKSDVTLRLRAGADKTRVTAEDEVNR